MNTMRTSLTMGDTSPTPIGAAYTAILMDTGEVQIIHTSDNAELPLEKRDIVGYTAYTRGTPYFTAIHVNLIDITHPGLLANALVAERLLPLLTSERIKLVNWMKANRKHLQRLRAAGM